MQKSDNIGLSLGLMIRQNSSIALPLSSRQTAPISMISLWRPFLFSQQVASKSTIIYFIFFALTFSDRDNNKRCVFSSALSRKTYFARSRISYKRTEINSKTLQPILNQIPNSLCNSLTRLPIPVFRYCPFFIFP